MGSTRRIQDSYPSSQALQRDIYSSEDPPTLRERVARLEADMAWVKKLSVANVMISATTLIGIILSIIMLAVGR